MTMSAQGMDSHDEDIAFDPMEAITERVLDALKPRKRQCMRARKYKQSTHEGTDPKVFVDFKDHVLAPTGIQTVRLRARELMYQLDTESSPCLTTDSAALAVESPDSERTDSPLSAAERDFALFMEVFARVSEDIELECRDRGRLLQRLTAKANSAFETARDMAKDRADDVEKLQAQVACLETENKSLQETIRVDNENSDKMRVTLAKLQAKNRYLELNIEQKRVKLEEQRCSIATQEAALKNPKRKTQISRVLQNISALSTDIFTRGSIAEGNDSENIDMVDGSTSPMMMFSSFHNATTGGTFMTQEDDVIPYDLGGWSATPLSHTQDAGQAKFGVLRAPAEEATTHAKLASPDKFYLKTESPHRQAHNCTVSTRNPLLPPRIHQDDQAAVCKAPSLAPSVTSHRRGTNLSRCSSRGSSRHAQRRPVAHHEHRTSKSSSTSALRTKTRRLSFPSELPFSNFVSLKSDWEFTHDPALMRAKVQAEAQLAEAHREVQTQMASAESTAGAIDKVIRMMSASFERVQLLIEANCGASRGESYVSGTCATGVHGPMHHASDLSALMNVLKSVLDELSCKSCHEWAHFDVDATLSDFYTHFDVACDSFVKGQHSTSVAGSDKINVNSDVVSEGISGGTRFLKKAGDASGTAPSLRASIRRTVRSRTTGFPHDLRLPPCVSPSSKSSSDAASTPYPVCEMMDADVQTDPIGPPGACVCGYTPHLVRANSTSSREDDMMRGDVAMVALSRNSNHGGGSVSSGREGEMTARHRRNQDSPAGSHLPGDVGGKSAPSVQSNDGDAIVPLRRVGEQIMLLKSRFADLIDLSHLPLRRLITVWPPSKMAKFIDAVYAAIWEKIRVQAKNGGPDAASAQVLPTSEVSITCWTVLRRLHGADGANSAHEKAMQLIDSLSDALQNDTSREDTQCAFVDYLVGTRAMGELTFHLYSNALQTKMPRSDILLLLFGDLPRAYARGKECEGDNNSAFQVLTAYRDCEDVPCWRDVSHAFVMADCGAAHLRGKVSHIPPYGSAGGNPKSLGALFYIAYREHAQRDPDVAIKDTEVQNQNVQLAMVEPTLACTAFSGNTTFKAFHGALKHSVEMFDTWLADSITRCMKRKDDANLLTVVLHALMSRIDLRGALLPVVLNALTEVTASGQVDDMVALAQVEEGDS
eukprot:GEMP01004281.1.p1 GENE.GEMP01004281.1~~GEMP01004281.1.p1  ORF type:complete len:1163 (+),score=287.83 GEMP01004281.1:38-3526(+)